MTASRESATPPPLTVSAFGMQLHAATTVDGRDREQLGRLCRCMLRPPSAHDAGRAPVHHRVDGRDAGRGGQRRIDAVSERIVVEEPIEALGRIPRRSS